MGIAFDRHLLGEAHAADGADPAHVVAAQINQHQMLGQFLGIGQQFRFQRLILLLGGAAPAGAGDGAHRQQPVLQPRQNLRRGADDVEIAQVEKIHVGRGVQPAQRPVQIQRRGLEWGGQSLRQHHLHAISGQDVVLDPPHRVLEAVLGEAGYEFDLMRGRMRAVGRIERARAAQQFAPVIQTLLGAGIGALHRWVHQGDQVQPPRQVVEHHHILGHQQQDVRVVHRVGIGAARQFGLDVADGVVAEIADQATDEARQTLAGSRHPITGLELLNPGQRVRAVQRFDDLAGVLDGYTLATHPDDLAAGQADDGVAAPLLAALHRFEQVAVRRVGQFEIGAKRRVEISQDFAGDGNAVEALFNQALKLILIHLRDSREQRKWKMARIAMASD